MPKANLKRVTVTIGLPLVTIEYDPETLKRSFEKSLRLTNRSEEQIQAAAWDAVKLAEESMPELFEGVTRRMMVESFGHTLRKMKVVRGNMQSVHKGLLQDEDEAAKLRLGATRGRPAKWTRSVLEQKIRRAVNAFKKKEYRSPTLPEVAGKLGMPDATLKKLLFRYGLRYSTYKKET